MLYSRVETTTESSEHRGRDVLRQLRVNFFASEFVQELCNKALITKGCGD